MAKVFAVNRSMNADRITLDTNILIYAIDQQAGDRHDVAMTLVDDAIEQDCVLTLQALSEFFAAATRKGKMPIDDAEEQILDWQILFPIVTPKPSTLPRAINAVKKYQLSFWDAMLWATAREAGVTVLLTEDFQHGQIIDGIRFHDPFIS